MCQASISPAGPKALPTRATARAIKPFSRAGETRWGDYATRTRVKADRLVPLLDGLTTRNAMAIGTAGLTAMLAVMALEEQGLDPTIGEVLVAAASGLPMVKLEATISTVTLKDVTAAAADIL